MKIGLVSFTARGKALAARLAALLTADGHECETHCTREGTPGVREWTAANFTGCGALVFVGAAGIAVRAIAPHVRSKASDPAVLVVDETGAFVIPLLSGHLGGANALAQRLAQPLDAVAVVTTATDRNDVFAVDVWAKDNGLAVANPGCIKRVSGALLAGETVRIWSNLPIGGAPPDGVVLCDAPPCEVRVTIGAAPADAGGDSDVLRLVPRVVAAGIGCRKDVGAERIKSAFLAALDAAGIDPLAVYTVASVDLKAREPGLLAFCAAQKLPFVTFSPERLAALPGAFTGSAFVQSIAGVDSVCERSAVAASGGPLLLKKFARDGVTVALAARPDFSIQF